MLVADDRVGLRNGLRSALTLEGYEVELASNGVEALAAARSGRPDVIVLDVKMPMVDGLEVCRTLRMSGDATPVLMLTVKSALPDRVAGLDAGADDYLVKPFALEELLARVRALARRSRVLDGPSKVMRFEDLRVDTGSREAWRGDRRLALTRTEFDLLALFVERHRNVVTKDEIMQRVWGFQLGSTSNTLAVHVACLRSKLEAEGELRLLHTVRGVGFVLRES